jgi:two-component sensor histidine kinase
MNSTELDESGLHANAGESTTELLLQLRRQISQLEHENRELLSVQSAIAMIASSLDLQFVFENVTWELARLLKVERCVIYDSSPEHSVMQRVAKYDSQGALLSAGSFDLTEFPSRQRALAEKFTWQSVADAPELDRSEKAYMVNAGIKTILLLPLVFQERVVGLIEVSDCREQRVFSDREISLAQMLSTQIAAGIENARLYRRSEEEIARRLEVEEQLRKSLGEKEILLKEIHHRVKNNLQTVSSILNLQSRSISDPSVVAVFRDSQARVRTMAMIHEKLYRSDDLNRINFAEYGHSLATYLVRSYQVPSRPVFLKMEPSDVRLSIDSAVPCGLIINELVTNSLKYAFPPDDPELLARPAKGQKNEIHIALAPTQGQQLCLTVSDNGIGFPDAIDFRETSSLGLRLVTTLTDQLAGTIDLSNRGGTCFKIVFPAQTDKDR